jgi:hypothetical protein
MEGGDRITDAPHPEVEEDTDRGRPSPPHVVNHQIRGKHCIPFQPITISRWLPTLIAPAQTPEQFASSINKLVAAQRV